MVLGSFVFFLKSLEKNPILGKLTTTLAERLIHLFSSGKIITTDLSKLQRSWQRSLPQSCCVWQLIWLWHCKINHPSWLGQQAGAVTSATASADSELLLGASFCWMWGEMQHLLMNIYEGDGSNVKDSSCSLLGRQSGPEGSRAQRCGGPWSLAVGEGGKQSLSHPSETTGKTEPVLAKGENLEKSLAGKLWAHEGVGAGASESSETSQGSAGGVGWSRCWIIRDGCGAWWDFNSYQHAAVKCYCSWEESPRRAVEIGTKRKGMGKHPFLGGWASPLSSTCFPPGQVGWVLGQHCLSWVAFPLNKTFFISHFHRKMSVLEKKEKKKWLLFLLSSAVSSSFRLSLFSRKALQAGIYSPLSKDWHEGTMPAEINIHTDRT